MAPRTGQVTSVDKTNHRYTFVPTGATAPMTVNYKASDTYSVDGTSVQMPAIRQQLGESCSMSAHSRIQRISPSQRW